MTFCDPNLGSTKWIYMYFMPLHDIDCNEHVLYNYSTYDAGGVMGCSCRQASFMLWLMCRQIDTTVYSRQIKFVVLMVSWEPLIVFVSLLLLFFVDYCYQLVSKTRKYSKLSWRDGLVLDEIALPFRLWFMRWIWAWKLKTLIVVLETITRKTRGVYSGKSDCLVYPKILAVYRKPAKNIMCLG